MLQQQRTNSRGEKYVIGPTGAPLTLSDLPPSDTERWVIRRKAEVVAAVRGGLLVRGLTVSGWEPVSLERAVALSADGSRTEPSIARPGRGRASGLEPAASAHDRKRAEDLSWQAVDDVAVARGRVEELDGELDELSSKRAELEAERADIEEQLRGVESDLSTVYHDIQTATRNRKAAERDEARAARQAKQAKERLDRLG
jgi:hypothetical protein